MGGSSDRQARVPDAENREHRFRHIVIYLDEPSRDGATEIHLLTNVPRRISARKLADAYCNRWSIETVMQS